MKRNNVKIFYTQTHEIKIDEKWTIKSAKEPECITYEQYKLIVGAKTLEFYRSINSPQIITRYRNGKVKRLISVSPDGMERIIYNFTFDPINNYATI